MTRVAFLWLSANYCSLTHYRARKLVQVTIYRRLLIGRDGHLDQSEVYDISQPVHRVCVTHLRPYVKLNCINKPDCDCNSYNLAKFWTVWKQCRESLHSPVHRLSHSNCVLKLLALPPQPPYVNCSQAPVSLLWNQWRKAALHLPVSDGSEQISGKQRGKWVVDLFRWDGILNYQVSGVRHTKWWSRIHWAR